MRPEESRTVIPKDLSAVGAPWQELWFEVPLKILLRCPKKMRTYIPGVNLE